MAGWRRAIKSRAPVVIVEVARGAGVVPVPFNVVLMFRCTAKLALGDTSAVAAEPGVVFQRLPGQG
jgi:hypothetical protein